MKSSSDSEGSEEFFDAEDSIPNRVTKYVVVVFAGCLVLCFLKCKYEQSLSPALRFLFLGDTIFSQ